MNSLLKNWLIIFLAIIAITRRSDAIDADLRSIDDGLENNCTSDFQCQNRIWGYDSRCNKQTARCECHDQDRSLSKRARFLLGNALNNTKTIYYKRLRKCLFKLKYNDTCTKDDNCQANLGPDVICGITNYTNVNACRCLQEKVCRGRQLSKSFSFGLIAGITLVVIVIEVVCLVLCCRIRSKRLLRKRAVIWTSTGTTTVSNGQTDTDSAIKSEPFTAAHVANSVVALPNIRNAGRRVYSAKENVAVEVPLLKPQQPAEYSNLPQSISFGHRLATGPHNQPQSFGFANELSSYPYNP